MCPGLGNYCRIRVLRDEAREAFEAAVAALIGQGDGGEEDGIMLRAAAHALAWQALFSDLHGVRSALASRGLDLLNRPEARALDVRRQRAWLLLQASDAALDEYQLDRSLEAALDASRLFAELADPWSEAFALYYASDTAWTQAAYGEADELAARAVDIFRFVGAPRELGRALLSLGSCLNRHGRRTEALAAWEEGATIMVRVGDRRSVLAALQTQAYTDFYAGEFSRAAAAFQEARELADDLGVGLLALLTDLFVDRCQALSGRYAVARRGAEASLTRARALEHGRSVAHCYALLGDVSLAELRLADALSLHARACDLADVPADEHHSFLAALALSEVRAGRFAEARGHLREARAFSAASDAFVPLCWAVPAAALLLAKQGDAARGLAVHELARWSFPLVAHARYFDDVVRRPLADLARRGLSTEAVESATESGQALSLKQTVADLIAELASSG